MKGLQVTPVWRFSWSMHVQWRHNKSRLQWAIYGRPDRCAVRTLHSLGITQPGDVRMIVGTGVLGPAAAAAPWLSQPQSHSDRRSLLRLTRFRAIAASGPVSAPHSLWARELGKYSSLSDHSYLPCLSPFLARRNNLLFIALLPNHYLLLFIQAKRLLSKVFLFFFLLQGFLLVMHTAFQSYCMCQHWLKYSHIRSMCGALFGSGCGRTLWTLLFLFSGS